MAYQGNLHWHRFELWEQTDPNCSKHKHWTGELAICWYLPNQCILSLFAPTPIKWPLAQWCLSLPKLKKIANDDPPHTWKKWTKICFHICRWSQSSRYSWRISMLRQTKSRCRCCNHRYCCWGWKLQLRNVLQVGFHKYCLGEGVRMRVCFHSKNLQPTHVQCLRSHARELYLPTNILGCWATYPVHATSSHIWQSGMYVQLRLVRQNLKMRVLERGLDLELQFLLACFSMNCISGGGTFSHHFETAVPEVWCTRQVIVRFCWLMMLWAGCALAFRFQFLSTGGWIESTGICSRGACLCSFKFLTSHTFHGLTMFGLAGRMRASTCKTWFARQILLARGTACQKLYWNFYVSSHYK